MNIAGKFRPLSFSKNRIATFEAIIANSVNYPPALEEEMLFPMAKLLLLKQTANSSNSTDTLNNRTATLDAVSATLNSSI